MKIKLKKTNTNNIRIVTRAGFYKALKIASDFLTI